MKVKCIGLRYHPGKHSLDHEIREAGTSGDIIYRYEKRIKLDSYACSRIRTASYLNCM